MSIIFRKWTTESLSQHYFYPNKWREYSKVFQLRKYWAFYYTIENILFKCLDFFKTIYSTDVLMSTIQILTEALASFVPVFDVGKKTLLQLWTWNFKDTCTQDYDFYRLKLLLTNSDIVDNRLSSFLIELANELLLWLFRFIRCMLRYLPIFFYYEF